MRYPACAMDLTQAQKALIKRIKKLKREKSAVVLCHNYQRPEIYEIADFIGDSLELCKRARDTDARVLVFSGVYFMAESAAILNPGMKVVIPSRDAGCALSDMITAEALRKRKQQYPDAAVVCYVNSSAAVKAESDICCTSSNAVAVTRSLPNKQILFVPDKNLAAFVAARVPEKEIIPWEGFCPIHQRLTAEYLRRAKEARPGAEIIAHPECTAEVQAIADHVVSTSGMIKVARESSATEFICTTECGMIQRMQRDMPGKKFYTVCSVCFDMKKNTLENIEQTLINETYEIKIPPEVRERALSAFERMFAVSSDGKRSDSVAFNNKLRPKLKGAPVSA